ncbi:4'-phosphopantetheinyl transferase superfamily protein [Beijerinckia indica]|uniref:4'-phosphopantetheinyl transferase n=1 Tax=Beijerinckia indica subsp. indica (strain ATCC 9039 / DSM 1715 / NCIMB 8712) TaxID=395963 RepID=B2ILM4_BEII9|nr:4'-phosphopantetheinyl transferase superfamily protein [Beijerinckia indica]ACB97424.1 4'-phosphopantetheinyl transferase [Beijerinckia indica subsp. indica ATCC 9039]
MGTPVPKQPSVGDLPLIGRVFEARAAEELALAVAVHEDLGNPEPPIPTPSSTASQPVHTATMDEAQNEAILPFLGPVLAYVPGETITVERHLTLEGDRYLADHAFVHAPGVKPASACLPVLPMTMSLEVMAEVAACLVPGYGLLGFEDVKATRWIELADTDVLTLHITARVDRHDEDRGASFIRVEVFIEGQTRPAISAMVLFGDHYLIELSPAFTELANPYRHPLTGEEIYGERHMFHGPSFHCLSGEIIVGDHGIIGEFVRHSPEDLFGSTRSPQLLIDPALLDGIGQILGVWAMEHGRYVFPIGLAKLEIYCPSPPVGTRVPVRVEITQTEGKRLLANVEVQDGAGAVWMRIVDWGSWKFNWEQCLVDFRRFPDQYLLGRAAPLPNSGDGSVCLTVTTAEFQNFDFSILARHCLSMEEMPVFNGHARIPQRQKQWLLGRVVAKDAVRLWAAEQTQAPMLHPAAFTIDNDGQGRPFVRALPGCNTPPLVSIAHSETRAIAVAHTEAVGVDIERIAEHDASFIQAFTTAHERNLIAKFPQVEHQTWITRLWCAKEATGKLLGTGINGLPQAFEAIQLENGGRIEIKHQTSARSFEVKTVEDCGFIIAYASQPHSSFGHKSESAYTIFG